QPLDVHIGALLFIEASIPTEFACILQKVEELFALNEKAKKYLEDHITHDAQKHFPELVSLLPAFESKKVVEGIDWMFTAKMEFYASLKDRL
ncbi:MAG: hypothetical protein COU33_02970, partial [Candidatus Magasanikbacteria bacterium CG10_big_fil_rev_8_21_14_0_10_43_6]